MPPEPEDVSLSKGVLHVGPMRRAVPGTGEVHDGQGTSIFEGEEGKEVGDAR